MSRKAAKNDSGVAIKLENISQLQGESIPSEVIEAILSRLPVKSLIRLQIISKFYKAIISGSWFPKLNYIHLSKSPNLFLKMEEEIRKEGFSLVRLEGESFQTEADLGAPFGYALPLCSCDGLVLLLSTDNDHELVLWNPSIRRYTTIQNPLRPADIFDFGLYHDSKTDDYKVVVIATKYNLVFSCKTRIWAEEELVPCRKSKLFEGVLVDGCYYWQKESDNGVIFCYDFRERKTEKLKFPDDLEVNTPFRLTTLWGRLSLHQVVGRKLHSREKKLQIWVRENHGYYSGWRKMSNMEKTGVHLCPNRQQVEVGRNISSCIHGDSSYFVIYNDCEKQFEETYKIYGVRSFTLVPCSESLFFPFQDTADVMKI